MKYIYTLRGLNCRKVVAFVCLICLPYNTIKKIKEEEKNPTITAERNPAYQ